MKGCIRFTLEKGLETFRISPSCFNLCYAPKLDLIEGRTDIWAMQYGSLASGGWLVRQSASTIRSNLCAAVRAFSYPLRLSFPFPLLLVNKYIFSWLQFVRRYFPLSVTKVRGCDGWAETTRL